MAASHRAKHRVLGLCAGACAFFGGAAASANSPAPFSRPTGVMPGALLERPSPVVVEREDLDIDCTESEGRRHPKCRFVATYHLFNPAANGEELLGAFYSADREAEYHQGTTEPVSATMDGQSVLATATDAELARMDQIVDADVRSRELIAEKKLTLSRRPFHIEVPAGAKKELVFAGELAAFDYRDRNDLGGYAFPAIMMRHPVVGRNDHDQWAEGWDEFYYLVSPIATWAGDPQVHVRIKHKANLDFSSALNRFARERAGDVVTERTVIRAKSGENLRFKIGYSPWPIFNGGPLAGIGPRFGRAELHTRFGYELGISESFILGGVVDTNFEDYVTPAITLDGATPNIFLVIPALSFGVGATAQLRRDTDPRIGIRTQFGLTFPLLSFSFPIDIYPAANSSGSHVEGAFLTQLSF